MDPDPFDELLGLEEQFYQEGYQLGVADREKAGRIEGRAFGLEKGFEKYVEAGRLHGRSLIWAARLPGLQSGGQSNGSESANSSGLEAKSSMGTVEHEPNSNLRLGNLPDNPRLEKHVKVLYALTEPVSLSTENTDDAVSDFDDRLKRAQGKIKIIERLTGEDFISANGGERAVTGSGSQQSTSNSAEGNIEDVSVLKAKTVPFSKLSYLIWKQLTKENILTLIALIWPTQYRQMSQMMRHILTQH